MQRKNNVQYPALKEKGVCVVRPFLSARGLRSHIMQNGCSTFVQHVCSAEQYSIITVGTIIRSKGHVSLNPSKLPEAQWYPPLCLLRGEVRSL